MSQNFHSKHTLFQEEKQSFWIGGKEFCSIQATYVVVTAFYRQVLKRVFVLASRVAPPQVKWSGSCRWAARRPPARSTHKRCWRQVASVRNDWTGAKQCSLSGDGVDA